MANAFSLALLSFFTTLSTATVIRVKLIASIALALDLHNALNASPVLDSITMPAQTTAQRGIFWTIQSALIALQGAHHALGQMLRNALVVVAPMDCLTGLA